jgi:hypothetical protein
MSDSFVPFVHTNSARTVMTCAGSMHTKTKAINCTVRVAAGNLTNVTNPPFRVRLLVGRKGEAMTTQQKKTSHTPGPWRDVAPPILSEKGSPFKIIDDNYRLIRGGTGFFEDKNPSAGFSVCGFITPESAHLLASAPEMLEALEDIADTLDKMAPCPEEILDRLLACAQSAIRLAKGEPR